MVPCMEAASARGDVNGYPRSQRTCQARVLRYGRSFAPLISDFPLKEDVSRVVLTVMHRAITSSQVEK
jgi:hypothetical protein